MYFCILFIFRKENYSKHALFLVSIFGSLYAPLFLVKKVEVDFISLVLFAILTIPSFKKNIKKIDFSFVIVFILSLIVFIVSASWVVIKDIVIDEDIDSEIKYAITSRYRTINDNVYEREVLNHKLFYFENNRLFSSDGNLNYHKYGKIYFEI